MNIATAHCPDVITKELAIARLGDHRRIRLSSNFLPMVGFEKDSRFVCEPIGAQSGLRLRFDPKGTHKIHQRRYNQRGNNPFETQIDLQSQNLINATVPQYTERLHFQLQRGEILVTPLPNRTFAIRKHLGDTDNPFKSFVGLTSGVDVHCLQEIGFTIDSVMEFRPQEARDKTNLTETGAVNILANANPRVVINENIFNVDWRRVEKLIDLPAIGMVHLSPQCDDFSNVKANSLKQKSVENLDTTRDMFIDCLNAIETLNPATVVVENVPGFADAAEGELMRIRLRRMGYHVIDGVFDAREFGGLTSRKRYYMVATIWPGFEMPAPVRSNKERVWDVVSRHLADCRDVSHTKSVKLGIETGRIRTITPESTFSPTFTKSQARQAKDSVYIEVDGRFLLPTEALMRDLMGLPESFNLNSVSATIASEIIGQSIEYPLHHAIAQAVYDHISLNTGHCTVTKYKMGEQLGLFHSA